MFNTLFTQGGLTLDRLRTFCTVAEAAGVTKAAGRNPVRQSQFSRQIKELETFFQTELMMRGKKGIVLTPAGKQLAQISRGIFSALEDFNSDCKAEPQRFAIGAGDSLLLWLVLPRVTILQNALPNVALDVSTLRTLDIVERVNDLRLDFGLIRRDAVSPLQRFKSLGFETYGLFVPRGLLAKQRVRDWKEVIAKIPLTTIAGEGTFRAALEKAARKNGISLTFCLSCSTFPQATSALRTGHYAAILPTIAAVELEKDQFTIVPAPFIESQAREICLIWNPRTLELRPKATEFKDCLVNSLKLSGKSTVRQA